MLILQAKIQSFFKENPGLTLFTLNVISYIKNLNTYFFLPPNFRKETSKVQAC